MNRIKVLMGIVVILILVVMAIGIQLITVQRNTAVVPIMIGGEQVSILVEVPKGVDKELFIFCYEKMLQAGMARPHYCATKVTKAVMERRKIETVTDGVIPLRPVDDELYLIIDIPERDE